MIEGRGKVGAEAERPYLEFAARGRNAWWRYVVALTLTLALAIGLGAAVGAALSFVGASPRSMANELVHPAHPPLFMLAVGFDFAVVLGGLFLGVWLVQRKTPADLIGRWSWRNSATGAAVWLVMLLVMTGADLVAAPSGFRWSAGSGTAPFVACAVLALGVQTFAEEVVFRGYVTQAMLLATRRAVPAAMLAGLIFGVVHIPNGLPQAASATAFGVAASLIAIRLRGVAFTFGLHWMNNLYGAAAVVAGNDVFHGFPGLVAQTTPGLVWFDVATNVLALTIVCAAVLRVTGQNEAAEDKEPARTPALRGMPRAPQN